MGELLQLADGRTRTGGGQRTREDKEGSKQGRKLTSPPLSMTSTGTVVTSMGRNILRRTPPRSTRATRQPRVSLRSASASACATCIEQSSTAGNGPRLEQLIRKGRRRIKRKCIDKENRCLTVF
eukprot:SAG22_NODE_1467_length_4349_cov_3.654353_2_plen_124_part_00